MENDTRTRALIVARMPQRSMAQLERETGIVNIPRRLSNAAKQRYIPLDVLAAVHEHAHISIPEMVVSMFADAGYEDLLPYEIDPATVSVLTKLLLGTTQERALVAAWVDWLRSIAPTQP